MEFIQARNYTRVSGQRAIHLVVIHTMENPEKPGQAAAVARWFGGARAPRASAHYCIDAQEVVGCVREQDIAWAAPGANTNGIQLEHAGYAAQGLVGWGDAYSQAMLRRSALLCAEICKRHSIPVAKLEAAELLAHGRGICGHVDVTRAFKKSTHTDPGLKFPWAVYLGMVQSALVSPNPVLVA